MATATLTIDTENPIFKNGFYGTVLVLRDDADCHTIDYENRFNRNVKGRNRLIIFSFL